MIYTMTFKTVGLQDHLTDHVTRMTLRGVKEYAQVEEVSARFRDLVTASDLSCGIGVSETVEYWEKVQRTSTGSYIDLVPSKNGTGTCLTHAWRVLTCD
jgi:hypothetical protein